ncbi:MAG: AEC family transporter [Actinomycetes bacterium]
MQGVLAGFATIIAVIVLGFALAHYQVLGGETQVLLARLVFFVATPALLFQLLAQADIADVFSAHLAVAALSVAVSVVVYAAVARVVWRAETGDVVVGVLCSSYVNAGNLGLPIAVYVLGQGSYIAPILLLQLLVIAPAALAVLDGVSSGARPSLGRVLSGPVRNPVILASMLGLLVAAAGWKVPAAVAGPVDLVAGIAVPGALLAYGIALRVGPRPMAGGSAREVALATVLKLVVQPGVAVLLGREVFGLTGTALLAVAVTAALPTAQNVFIYAARYDRATVLARDAIFATTVLSVPVLLVVAAVLT